MKRDLFWTSLITRIAEKGAVSYNDLKHMDIEEFFLIVLNYDKRDA